MRSNEPLFKISGPAWCIEEQKWIIDLLLNKFLGIPFYIKSTENLCFLIEFEERTMQLSSDFFSSAKGMWLEKESLPQKPLAVIDAHSLDLNVNLTDRFLPVIYGSGDMEISEEFIRLDLDIFGSSFYMLSRYEEAVIRKRDRHDRFPVKESLAHQEGFLNRPIVNEYVEILWACIKHLWPGISRKKREPRTLITVDVDSAYEVCTKTKSFLRQLALDQYRNKKPTLAYKNLRKLININRGNFEKDEYYAMIHWIMNVNEAVGNRVIFYFLADESRYSLEDDGIKSLLKKINSRGHEIGLHAGYNSYKSKEQTCREADNLRRVLIDEGIDNDVIGARQHYLRWSIQDTALNLQTAGIKYDSTLAYSEFAGFRCGTCYEYELYDLLHRKSLDLIERPLTIMESSMFDLKSIGLDYSKQALEYMQSLKRKCQQFSGDFVLLWHNSRFESIHDMEVYSKII